MAVTRKKTRFKAARTVERKRKTSRTASTERKPTRVAKTIVPKTKSHKSVATSIATTLAKAAMYLCIIFMGFVLFYIWVQGRRIQMSQRRSKLTIHRCNLLNGDPRAIRLERLRRMKRELEELEN